MASSCCRLVITLPPPRNEVISCDRQLIRCNFSSISCIRNSKLKLTATLRMSSRKNSKSEEAEEDDDDDDDGKKRHKIATWKKWVVGISLSLLLPSYRHKLGPLGLLKERVNEVIETTETMTEVVEDVAEGVKHLAEEYERGLPSKDANGKLKEALDLVEKLAEKTIKTTDLSQELIEKVEEAEDMLAEEVDEMLEDLIAKARKQKEKAASRDKR